MATLIIGGNGLIGTHLVKHLCDMGEEVISFSSHQPGVLVKGCKYIAGDVTEYGTLNQILHTHKVDRILHNAAVSHPKLFRENPYKIYRINVGGTLTALEAARNYGVSRFIYMSSGAVYGNTTRESVTEETPLRSESPYGATKVACEELVRNYGLDSTSLRIGFVYGPGRKFECPIHMLLADCIQKKQVNWEQGIDQRMDYIYIDDCVEAIVNIAMASQLPHTEYNVGGGQNVPYSRVVDCARNLCPDVIIEVGAGTLGYDNLGAMSIKRVYDVFGWQPKVSIEAGMALYHDWLLKEEK